MFDLLQMEWFPAGRGAVLSAAGHVQLDAIIMNGETTASGTDFYIRRISKSVTFVCFIPPKVGICLSASSIQLYCQRFLTGVVN